MIEKEEQKVKADKAKYYQDTLQQQIQEKEVHLRRQKEAEQNTRFTPICQEAFENEDQMRYYQQVDKQNNLYDLQDQLAEREYVRRQQQEEKNEFYRTGLEVNNAYVNTFLPSQQEY